MKSHRFDRGDVVILARRPDDFTWSRHRRELTIGARYTIVARSSFSNKTSYVVRNDRGCIVDIQDEFFDPVSASE